MIIGLTTDTDGKVELFTCGPDTIQVDTDLDPMYFSDLYNDLYYIDGAFSKVPNGYSPAPNRSYDVSQIIATTASGKIFDGDEDSQSRMLRSIHTLETTGASTIEWKLADNSKVDITLSELKEALALANAEQSRLWMLYSSG